MSIVTIGAALVVSAMTVVTANLLTSHTPLYTVRMEQMSSKMIFLPTVTNESTYVTQNGVKVDYRCPNQDNLMVIHGNQIIDHVMQPTANKHVMRHARQMNQVV